MGKRESNFELLRILSMFLIVLYHVIFHGNIIKFTTGSLQAMFEFIKFFTMIHVNCFILIMGYFQSKSEFKIKKVYSILFQVWFYNILLNSLLNGFGIVEYTNIEFINAISPFNLNSYWFVYCYLIMYILSPFVNKVIEKTDRITLKKLIILLISIFSIVPYITMGLAWKYNMYSIEQFIEITNLIREYYNDAILTTDVIVGFPGETEEEFNITYENLKKIKFYKMHVFKYSVRSGTKAACMENQVDSTIKEKRSKILLKLSDYNEIEYNKEYIGKDVEVLFEEEKYGYFEGHTKNYIMIKVKTNENLEGKIKLIKITEQNGLDLVGTT